jgi:hypothetical protein
VNGAYAWRARATFNHRSFKDYLQILAVPVFLNRFQHIAHALLIDQELAGSHRAASPDPRCDDYELIRVGIEVPAAPVANVALLVLVMAGAVPGGLPSSPIHTPRAVHRERQEILS